MSRCPSGPTTDHTRKRARNAYEFACAACGDERSCDACARTAACERCTPTPRDDKLPPEGAGRTESGYAEHEAAAAAAAASEDADGTHDKPLSAEGHASPVASSPPLERMRDGDGAAEHGDAYPCLYEEDEDFGMGELELGDGDDEEEEESGGGAAEMVLSWWCDVAGEGCLRPVEGTILILVGANPGCIQSELGRALGIKRANMVPLIAGLTAQNYLEKSPVDGRSFALSLTPRGEEARARVDGIMDAHEAGFARLLADVDQQQLRAALSLIASGRD